MRRHIRARRCVTATLAAVILASCSPIGGAPAIKSGTAASSVNAVDAYVRSEAQEGFSGSVLVLRNGLPLLHKGYGTLGSARTAKDTRYWIASVTKQFTSAAILKLRDDGLLNLSDGIGRFFPDAPADKQQVSIQHLLTHKSGLPQAYVADGIGDRSAAVKTILAQPSTVPPGQKFQYSNDNYQLAAAIVEIASGRSFEDFVTAELLNPAGMSNTGFWAQRGSDSVAPITLSEPQSRQWGQLGSGGMYSTTGDLARWLVMLRRGTALSPGSARDLFSQHVPLGKLGSYGFGWFRSDDGIAGPRVWTRGNESYGPNAFIDIHHGPDLTIILLSHSAEAPDGTI